MARFEEWVIEERKDCWQCSEFFLAQDVKPRTLSNLLPRGVKNRHGMRKQNIRDGRYLCEKCYKACLAQAKEERAWYARGGPLGYYEITETERENGATYFVARNQRHSILGENGRCAEENFMECVLLDLMNGYLSAQNLDILKEDYPEFFVEKEIGNE